MTPWGAAVEWAAVIRFGTSDYGIAALHRTFQLKYIVRNKSAANGGFMAKVHRRQFSALALSIFTPARKILAAPALNDALRAGATTRKIPAVAAMIATPDRVVWSGAFGARDQESGVPVKPDSIFSIASMTKAITTTAALQLVERGLIRLDEPVSKHLPQFENPDLLTGFDAAGKPLLRPCTKPITLKHLLTHTSGLVYDIWDGDLLRYESAVAGTPAERKQPAPLIFEPGARWEYGTGLDWTGRLIETVTGLTLEDYFQGNILQPLGMKDTSYTLPASRFDRMVNSFSRQPDGALKEEARQLPSPPKAFNGGGGLYSTPPDYIRFMQMILRRGRGDGKQQILRPETVDMMASNQIGPLSAGKLKTVKPQRSCDVDLHKGFVDGWGYGFLINKTAYEGGRSAGSLAWAGIMNTFYWIDPRRSLCATVMMQFLPFCDPQAVGLLSDFERAVYATV
jgi:methyl acetate hydrolase